jgi:hypothetical protein
MGRSWVLAIELEVPKEKTWLASTPDATKFDDWPELLRSIDPDDRRLLYWLWQHPHWMIANQAKANQLR